MLLPAIYKMSIKLAYTAVLRLDKDVLKEDIPKPKNGSVSNVLVKIGKIELS